MEGTFTAHTVNQEIGKQEALNQLKDDGALLVMDWAMKYMPQKYREKMTDFFGKQGVNWHVSAVITKRILMTLMSTVMSISSRVALRTGLLLPAS